MEKQEKEDSYKQHDRKTDMKTDTTEIKWTFSEYCEQLHANILYNLEESKKFLSTHTLPIVDHEEIVST
jgi:hypothetical protein